MKMCDILHLRMRKLWLRSDSIFKMTSHSGEQEKLLGIIHGLTKRVIKSKKEAFKKGTRGSLAVSIPPINCFTIYLQLITLSHSDHYHQDRQHELKGKHQR